MIKFLQAVSATKAAALATGLLVLAAPTTSFAAKINSCDRWAGKTAMPWIGENADASVTRSAAYLLLDARSHGLNPADYDAAKFARQASELLETPLSSVRVKRFNKQFTTAVVCYLQNVSAGRLNPHAVHKGVFLPRQKFNQHKLLSQAFDTATVSNLLLNGAPQSEAYANLRNSLSRLHALSIAEGALSDLKIRLKGSIEIGDEHSALNAIRDRLVFLGDADQLEPHSTYEYETVKAVIRFQQRHGLTPDGVIGKSTLAAMAVPMTHRAAQTELAMERIRWYPRVDGKRLVSVNIPEFTMTAQVTDANGDTDALSGKVIVGKRGSRHTPLFAGPITRIEFSPMWYVPKSIARKALLPRLRRDPGYMKRAGMEFRLPSGAVTQRVNASMLKRIANGTVSMQQRSGPRNALGKVKFILPNRRAIFLHDTSNRKLFGKDYRALSYGCVRLEKPLALAKLLLADQPQWTTDAIEKAASYGKTIRTHTSEDTMVMLQYQTAVADGQGIARFLPDIYKFDVAAKRSVKRWNKPSVPTAQNAELLAQLQAGGLS